MREPASPPRDLIPLARGVLERARVSRDPRFDGRFFVAVTTTGIYCRPVCPAPSPKSAHVRYFPTAAAAAEAGFRPCLRCRPEAAPGTPAWLGTSAVVRRALRLIHDGALDECSIEAFAARVGIGPRHLHRLFAHHVGASPIAVAQTRRLQFAKRLLDETELPVTEIALASGFGSLRRFNDAFQRTYARAPREIRKRPGKAPRRDEITLRLAYRPPYDWAFVRDFLAARAIPGVERVDDRGYARTLALSGGDATVAVRPVPGCHELELSVRGADASALFQLSLDARRAFDLAADPALTARAFARDPLLALLAKRRPGLRIPGAWDPFECAVRAVLGQQVSVAAGRTLAARLVGRAGRALALGPAPGLRPAAVASGTPASALAPTQTRSGASDEPALTHVFPSPEALATADLSGIGITGARIAAIQTLARAVVERRIDFTASADEVAAGLEALPGIGPWTAQYIALRALGEPDAFPAADLVLRRMAAARKPASAPLSRPTSRPGGREILSPRALEQRAEAWRPWRSYAVLHLWCAAGEQATRNPTALEKRA